MADQSNEDKCNAMWSLAERLYETMQRLSPPADPNRYIPEWANLTERQKEFYVFSVEALFEDTALIHRALVLADNDAVLGRTETTK